MSQEKFVNHEGLKRVYKPRAVREAEMAAEAPKVAKADQSTQCDTLNVGPLIQPPLEKEHPSQAVHNSSGQSHRTSKTVPRAAPANLEDSQ